MNINETEKVVQLVRTALDDQEINSESSALTNSSWDSIGQLSVLTALDDATGGRVSELAEFNNVNSVKEIIRLLEKHQISL